MKSLFIKVNLLLTIIFLTFTSMVLSAEVRITASSSEDDLLIPRNVLDGDMKSRWSSEFSDCEWLKIDLGETREVSGLTISWEGAYAISYEVQTSLDGKDWGTVFSQNCGEGGYEGIEFEKVEARYIKISFKERATEWGYSIWEINPVFSGKPKFPEGSMAKSKSKGKIKFDRFQSKAAIPLKKEYFYKPASKKLIKKVTASSSRENHEAVKAVDAGLKTYWFSNGSGEQWFQIEFKEGVILGTLKIRWNREAAAHFKIQVSDNGVKWNEVKDVDHVGEWDNRLIKFDSVGCRFMRILCICPCHYGYSIRDIKINPIQPRAIWKKKRM